MALNTVKFSQFANGSYSNTTNQLVGVTANSGGTNFKLPAITSWTTSGRPISPATGLLGYNTSLGQYEYWNGVAWVQVAAGGSGTVTSGVINQTAYYAATGTAVSGLFGYNQNQISSTSTLTSAYFNTQVLCTGSTGYVVTLPNGDDNNYIDFNVLTTSNALVTITPASGTIQGQASFVLGSGESCRVYSDATNWWVENLTLTPVNFSAYLSANQGMGGGLTVAAIDTITYDIGSFFNTSTHRYTPLYPGKYQVSLAVYYNGVTVPDVYEVYLFKNGSTIISQIEDFAGGTSIQISLSALVSLNGTTDYIDIECGGQTGFTLYSANGAAPYLTYFQATRISNF